MIDINALLDDIDNNVIDGIKTGSIIPQRVNWKPLAGKQAAAYYSDAHVIGYGGAAGGGKTDLGLGKGFTQFRNGVIYRSHHGELRSVITRGNELTTGLTSFVAGDKRCWEFADGRRFYCLAVNDMKDVEKHRGQARDFMVFDEAANIDETVYRMLTGWLRTTDQGGKTQVLITFNPPGSRGLWLLDYFAPWVKRNHPNPAEDGELRWYISDETGRDVEVPDNTPIERDGKLFSPRSRTFFHAKVEDNPYLMESGYRDQLNSLPEPLRSQLLEGKMDIDYDDGEWQVIPTLHIMRSMDAHKQKVTADTKGELVSCGVDPARGGGDAFAVCLLYKTPEFYYAEPHTFDGKKIINGSFGAETVLKLLNGRTPQYGVHVDSIGYGASVYDKLSEYFGSKCYPVNVGRASPFKNMSGTHRFVNLRSAAWWLLRECLDSELLRMPDNLELLIPHSFEMQKGLSAVRYSIQSGLIMIESKEFVRDRIGRSTDAEDALLLALLGVLSMSGWNVAKVGKG
jgi:hypothetical protein